MIFSLATLFDLDQPPYAVEAQEYYLLARLALRWAPPSFDTTLEAIQSIVRHVYCPCVLGWLTLIDGHSSTWLITSSWPTVNLPTLVRKRLGRLPEVLWDMGSPYVFLRCILTRTDIPHCHPQIGLRTCRVLFLHSSVVTH